MMCNPALALAGVGVGMSLYGMSKSASAQRQAADAIAQQNATTQAAQNEGFTARMAATGAQTEAQKQAFQQTIGNETDIANAMRARQMSALQQQRDTQAALNAQEQTYRNTGYTAANDLMSQTSGTNLGQASEDWRTQAANLLNTSEVPALGPGQGTGQVAAGTGSDPSVNAALARRAAEAATNIRGYGAKAAKLASYAAPLMLTQNAITENQTGIMPAAAASQLLQSSAPILFEPARVNYGQAGAYGQIALAAAEQAGQAAQNIAGLQYQNSTDLANLTQQDKTVTAANIADQARADAAYKAAMGGVISGIGNLALYGAGYMGGMPSLFGSKATNFPITGIGGGAAFGPGGANSGLGARY